MPQTKLEQIKKEKATDISFSFLSSGMVNNPNICIKDMGSTFACLCNKCIEYFLNK